MSWVVAHAFNCDLALREILDVLRDNTGLAWRTRDSDFWGDYLSASFGADVIAKIFIEEPGYLLELKFQDDTLRAEWRAASEKVMDEILPHLGARDIRRAPGNN